MYIIYLRSSLDGLGGDAIASQDPDSPTDRDECAQWRGTQHCARCRVMRRMWFLPESVVRSSVPDFRCLVSVSGMAARDARRGRLCRSSVDMSRRIGSHPCQPFHVSDAAGRIQRMIRFRVYPRRQSSHEQAGSVCNYHVRAACRLCASSIMVPSRIGALGTFPVNYGVERAPDKEGPGTWLTVVLWLHVLAPCPRDSSNICNKPSSLSAFSLQSA